MRKWTAQLTCVLLAALALPACSQFSADARRQRAYAKYVRKSSTARAQHRVKVQREQQEIPAAEERTETVTSVESVSAEG